MKTCIHKGTQTDTDIRNYTHSDTDTHTDTHTEAQTDR